MMLSGPFPDQPAERFVAGLGEPLLRRSVAFTWVTYVESGRVVLGLMEDELMAHQLGSVEGPCWLDAGAAVLALPSTMDALAETRVAGYRLAMPAFRAWLEAMPSFAQGVLQDIAKAHRQQTELAVSRLAKDAQARCAEWLLRNAQTSAQGSVAVLLKQRKRLIAAQLGITPETLSRVFRNMREHSLISGSGRVVNLVDPGALHSLAGA